MDSKKILKFLLFFTFFIAGILIVMYINSQKIKNFKLIPDNPVFVSYLNFPSLGEKLKESQFISKRSIIEYRTRLDTASPSFLRILNFIIEGKKYSGVDLNKNILFFSSKNIGSTTNCLAFDLSSSSQFVRFVKSTYKVANKRMFQTEHLIYYKVSNGAFLGWDNEKALILYDPNKNDKELINCLKYLFGLSEIKMFRNTSKFTNFLDENKDFGLWLSNDFLKHYKNDNLLSFYSYLVDKRDDLTCYLNLENGSVDFELHLTPNTDARNKIIGVKQNSFDKHIFKYLPQQSYATLALSIEPKSYISDLEKYEYYDRINNLVEQTIGIDLVMFLSSTGGDIVFSFNNYKKLKNKVFQEQITFTEQISNRERVLCKIGSLGKISSKDQILLNRGQTILADGELFYFNIRNLLKKGKGVQYALRHNAKVNCYLFDPYILTKKEIRPEEYLPQINVVFNIRKLMLFKYNIDNIDKKRMIIRSGYYEVKTDFGFPVYIAYNGRYGMLSNELNSIKKFIAGGYNQSAMNADIPSVMNQNLLFFDFDLNHKNYPNQVRNKFINANIDQFYKIPVEYFWKQLANKFELTYSTDNSLKLRFVTKNNNINYISSFIQLYDLYNKHQKNKPINIHH
jgi:hypothetical protein